MMTRRQLLMIAGGIAGFAGAGGVAAVGVLVAGGRGSTPTGAPEPLLADTDRGLAVVHGGGSRLIGANAAATPDARSAYVAEPNGSGATMVTVVDVASGAARNTISLAGQWVPRAVSPTGKLVALTAPGGAAPLSRPAGRDRTTITVAGDTGERHRLHLDGNYEPDAISSDGTRLFVLDWLPATAPEHYRVRIVDIASGEIWPLSTRDKQPVPAGAEEEMRGEGRRAVFSPDRYRLYTLYTHQPDHQHTRDLLAGGGRAHVHAFVHVLDLEAGWAYCLDLPDPFGQGPAAGHTLAVSPDGRRLFVADLGSGLLAEADTEALTVQRVTPVPSSPGATAYAAVSPDGRSLYLGGGPRITVVGLAPAAPPATAAATAAAAGSAPATAAGSAPATAAATAAAAGSSPAGWDADGPVRGLAVSRDGSRLYVGQPGAVAWHDPATGARLARQAVPGLTELRRALP
jgi:DNA-binding beta-propeller fold protein YncE